MTQFIRLTSTETQETTVRVNVEHIVLYEPVMWDDGKERRKGSYVRCTNEAASDYYKETPEEIDFMLSRHTVICSTTTGT